MPLYGTPQAGGPPAALGQGFSGNNLTVVQPGDSFYLFNDELPLAGQSSVAFAKGYAPGGQGATPIVFTISWAVAPTAVIVIQGANEDNPSDYQTLYTSTNKQTDFYSDAGEFAFYRAQLVSYVAGTSVEVIAQR